MLWRPNGWGLHSTPFTWSKDQLEYHGFLPYSFSPIYEESTQIGVSRPYNRDHKEGTRVRLGEQHTQDSNTQHNHAHKSQLELETQHTEFATQMELKLLTQWSECAGAESGCFRILKECLVFSSIRIGGPFYSPKAARSRWAQSWKAIPAFCRVVHRTVRCTTRQPLFMSGARFLSIWRAADRWSSRSVGAPNTVRCTPDSPVCPTDRWRDHVSCEDCAADHWRWRPLAHWTVRCTTGQSGEL
jgi:hypothetical protein